MWLTTISTFLTPPQGCLLGCRVGERDMGAGRGAWMRYGADGGDIGRTGGMWS